MRTAKLTLRIIALLALLIVAGVAVFWRQLLTPEQKLRYGLTFEAADELRQTAARASDDPEALSRYVNALVQEGNFGRAYYLMDLCGASYDGPAAEHIAGLRSELAQGQQEARFQRLREVRKCAAGEVFKAQELPAYQALLYLDGYRHAAAGDWHSARELLSAVEEKRLAPPLRPYLWYYQMRAYRLKGSAEQKAEIDALYEKLLASDAGAGLKSRARYNMLAWHLENNDPQAAGRLYAELDPGSEDQVWSYQKASYELAAEAWGDKDLAGAWSHAGAAVVAAPENRAAQAAGDLLIIIARTRLTGKFPDGTALDMPAGKFDLPLTATVFSAWAKNAALYGYALDTQTLLKQLQDKAPPEYRGDVLLGRATISAAAGDIPGLRALTAQPPFASAPVETRAEIRFLLAKLLHAKEQWNAALAEYRAVADLNSLHRAEAMLGRYIVLKEVQEPLNLAVALPILEQLAEDESNLEVRIKAVEELIPLLIYLGRRQDANQLAYAAEAADAKPLKSVGEFWQHYLGSGAVGEVRRFSYYEVAGLAEQAELVKDPKYSHPRASGPPEVAEYLAGLGLDVEATEAAANPEHESTIALYNRLRLHKDWVDTPRLQWTATEVLEQEGVSDPRLTRFLLELAYPAPYQEIVDKAAAATGVDPALIYAVMKKESNFKPAAVSSVGATGLMQLMPPTARMMANIAGVPAEPLTDPAVNIRLGAEYIANLQRELAGNIARPGPGEDEHDALTRAVLHSYNAGPGNYAKWRKLYPNADATLLTDLIPNEQNEEFGKRVFKYYQIYKWRLSQ